MDTSTSMTNNQELLDPELYNIDLCFMIDSTGSMHPYIEMTMEKINDMISSIGGQYPGTVVRIAVVAYRDVRDRKRFEVFNFSESVDDSKVFLDSLIATGGNDVPEDMNGGFQKALYEIEWKSLTRMLFHIADAPCHGCRFHCVKDDHPNGYKDDKPWEELFKDLKEKNISYSFFDIGAASKMMFEEFVKIYDTAGDKNENIMFGYEVLDVIKVEKPRSKFYEEKKFEFKPEESKPEETPAETGEEPEKEKTETKTPVLKKASSSFKSGMGRKLVTLKTSEASNSCGSISKDKPASEGVSKEVVSNHFLKKTVEKTCSQRDIMIRASFKKHA